MEMLLVQSSFAFLATIRGSKMQFFCAVRRHVWKREPKRGSHVTFDKDVRINKNQTESEDSNDPYLDLELDSNGRIKSLPEDEEGEEQELVIEVII